MVKTIKLEDTTHVRLAKICGKLETFDELINRLIDQVEGKRK